MPTSKAEDSELIQKLLVIANQEENLRVSRVDWDGRIFWIKRYDQDDRKLQKWLHRLASVMPIPPFLKSSPAVDAKGAADRERRKSRAFALAGIPVPEPIHEGEYFRITRHVGDTLLTLLRDRQTPLREQILLDAACSLGNAHVAGLCHGRPHLRDMFVQDAKTGFMDFEEEPEANMPMAVAQARDTWLFFAVVADEAVTPDEARDAFNAYKRVAPKETLSELGKLVAFWNRFLSPISKIPFIKPGADLRRLFKADALLYGNCNSASADM